MQVFYFLFYLLVRCDFVILSKIIMVKSHHTFFLSILDSVLESLNNPNKTYTLSYEELYNLASSEIKYDKLYQNQFSKFLTNGYDSYIETLSKPYLLNSALHFLIQDGYIFKFQTAPKQFSIQITHKGFLKLHLGFVKKHKNEIKKIQQTNKQQNFENGMSVLKTILPIITFILGFIINYFFFK